MEIGGDTTVDAQKLIVYDGREGEVVEQLHHEVIDFLVVFGEALIGSDVHSALKLKKEVSCLHSWLPLRR